MIRFFPILLYPAPKHLLTTKNNKTKNATEQPVQGNCSSGWGWGAPTDPRATQRSLATHAASTQLKTLTSNQKLISWVEEKAKLLKPNSVKIVTGSAQEQAALLEDLVKKGVVEKLNPTLRPNSYLCRTDPADVAR